jgi:hypothetical protein
MVVSPLGTAAESNAILVPVELQSRKEVSK